jgi:hypothetical protein
MIDDGQQYDYSECMRTHNVPFTPEEFLIVVRAVPKGAILLLGENNKTPGATVEEFLIVVRSVPKGAILLL